MYTTILVPSRNLVGNVCRTTASQPGPGVRTALHCMHTSVNTALTLLLLDYDLQLLYPRTSTSTKRFTSSVQYFLLNYQ